MSPIFSSTHHRADRLLFTKRRRGFALLITITLMGFLVLLLVSLAALTRVETAVAANQQKLEQARQNALMALNIALGQLQKHAGPDARVTARAEITSAASVMNPNLTGVWDAGGSGSAADQWLVSGSELAGATAAGVLAGTPDPGDDTVGDDTVFVVGNQSVAADPAAPTTAEKTRRIKLAKRDITAPPGSVPGLGATAAPRIGRYAWWVGDQGVKASLANPDNVDAVTYAPYNTAEARKRLRQQVAFDASPVELDPRDALNAGRVGRLVDVSQAGFMALVPPVDAVPSTTVRNRFHDWSATNYSVLANTTPDATPAYRGLRRDLSMKPSELGTAFTAYANYSTYLETPGTTTSGAPVASPAITQESPRRRHKITPPVTDQGWQHGIHPVLGSFIMQFNVRRQGTTTFAEVRSRFLMGLWNPYTSALVPEDMLLDIESLPTINLTTSSGSAPINLQALYGGAGPMRISLGFTETNPSFQGDPDDRSWLPGRVYYWRTKGGTLGNWDSEFYNRTLSVSNANIWTVPTAVLYPISGSALVTVGLSGPSTTLLLKLRRKSDNALLATYTSPTFDAFTVPDQQASSNNEYRITFPFRLAESYDTLATDPGLWLKMAGRDPRRNELGLGVYLPFGSGGTDPSASSYVGTAIPISASDRLLDRVMGPSGMSFNEDVPLFELPRQPLLSIGELQHLALTDGRPFAVGNSWGSSAVNKLFDRYFFSGLEGGTSPNLGTGQPLPNITQRVVPEKPDGTAVTLSDLKAQAATGLSSKYLLQGASFNINSTSVAAWRASLRGVRFTTSHPFEYVNATASSGTPVDDAQPRNLYATEAAFLRFPQSAQETYLAALPSGGGSTYGATDKLPPTAPNPVSNANTHLFRSGVKALSAIELDDLASAIVEGVRLRASASGPFRSLDEFLAPVSGGDFAGGSVIERAIAKAKINDSVAEFSSQFLTQADVVSALAPRFFVRSDTFLVRTFGEAVNPVTGDSTGKIWCEAVVQRLPSPLEAAVVTLPTDAEYLQPPGSFGRAFKLISFRWLTSSDI